MPVVPTYDNLKVTPTGAPADRAVNQLSPAEAAAPGTQLASLGGAVQKFGADVGDIELDMRARANQLRVNDAMNSAREAQLDLTYNPQTGYQSLKGKAALDTKDDDGKPVAMPDLYANKLKDHLSGIADTLTNPDQQEMFDKQSSALLTQFHGDVEGHMLGEYKTYHMSVNNGAIDLASQGAAASGITNPAATNQYIDTIKAANASNQQYTGESGNEITAKTDKQVSAIHAQAIQSGLENNDVTGAAAWFEKNKGQMVGDDILKSQGQINTKMDAFNAQHAVGQTTALMAPRLNPTSMDQLTTLMFGQESSGKQKGGPGSVAGPNDPTTSPKGAIGIAQILPTTGPEAAKLAGVEWDEDKFKNDAKYNATLGKAYFGQQLKTFGDVSKALAAYNAGPQAVKDAIAEAQAANDPNWLQHLPKETQNYVKTISDGYDSGKGVPTMPTELEFVNDAVARLGDNPRQEALNATRESAEKQYALAVKDRDQTAEQAQSRVQAELNQNGGSITNLSPSAQEDLKMINRLAPSKGGDILRYARYAQSTDKQVTNIEAYSRAIENPEEMARMTEPEFQNFLVTNFSPDDQKKMAVVRANVLNGKVSDAADSLNTRAVTQSLNNRLAAIGISTSKSAKIDKGTATRRAAIVSFVTQSIYDQQDQLQRKMTPKEIDDHVNNLFQQSTSLQGLFGAHDENMMNTEFSDIPGAEKQAILDNFAKHGIKTPTPDAVLAKWWRDRSAKLNKS